MGSKRPTLSEPPRDAASGDRRPDHLARCGTSTTRRLIGRIADALEITPANFYRQPNAAGAAVSSEETARAAETGLAEECAALLHAYRRIRDPAERRLLLALVQGAAERG